MSTRNVDSRPARDRYPQSMFGHRFPFFVVRVIGPSMEPTLTNGELWLARRSLRNLDEGRIVVFLHSDRPSLTQVKRVIRRDESGYWVEGDNHDQSTDSRDFGVIPRACIRGILIRRIA